MPPAADEHCPDTSFLPIRAATCSRRALSRDVFPSYQGCHLQPMSTVQTLTCPAMNGGSGHTSNLLISSSSSSSSSSATSPTPEEMSWLVARSIVFSRSTGLVVCLQTCKISPSEDISPASPKMNLPVVAPEVMRTASERHQKGLMSPYIYQILTQGEMKLPVLLEDENHKEFPSIHLLYRPVRQMVYAILF
ncbi:unnamed protein product, partial [Timema podura]|nr:unnamed protein product [Timema podura]